MFNEKEDIEAIVGNELTWRRLDNKKSSYIEISLDFDINNEDDWATAIKWHLDMASKLYDAFSDRIKKFN